MKKITFCLLFCVNAFATSSLENKNIYITQESKVNTYMSEGVVSGGSAKVEGASIKEIRKAKQKEFERVVLDIEQEKGLIPYYQVSLSPSQKTVQLSFLNKVKNQIDSLSLKLFPLKSGVIQSCHWLGPVQDGFIHLECKLYHSSQLEVFELKNPPRIVMDFKTTTLQTKSVGLDEVPN